MPSAPKFNPVYDVDDYRLWGGDWELIDGVAVSMTPSPFGPHQSVASEIFFQIKTQLKQQSCQDCSVLYDIDWIVNENTVVRPDILVSCDGVPAEHITSTPELVVEVLSEATRMKDQTVKTDLYAQRGVGFYLVADPIAKTLLIQSLVSGKYLPLQDGQAIELHEGCSIDVDSASFFLS
jgi:Uma2 family endonuclease